MAVGGSSLAATIPTTLETSVTYNGATFPLSTAMEVGYFVDGQPFVVAATATVGATSPSTSQVACDAYTDYPATSVSAGTLYWRNGVMKNPYFEGYPTPGTQGFDQLFQYAASSSQAAGRLGYTHALNIDAAATGSGIVVAPGDAFSLVKFIRKAGMTTPNDLLGSWRHADNYSVLHVVPTAPPVGAFAPCCSLDDADADRLNYYTLSQMNLAALGPGFSLPGSMPSTATCNAAGSVPSSSLTGHIHSSFQPFFGQWGEYQRRFMINPSYAGSGGVNGENSGYSRDWGGKWSEHLASVLAQGSGATQADVIKVVQIGLQLLGLYNRGSRGLAGAGQGAGHKQFVHLAAHLFHASHSGIMDRAMAFVGNLSDQQFWVTSADEGVFVTRGPQVTYGSNHDHNRRTYTAEHIGRPHWWHERADPRPDANFDADYECGSAESVSFIERTNICNLKAGPSGYDGSRTLSGGVTDYSTDASASVAYGYRYRNLYTADIHASDLPGKTSADYVTYFDESYARSGSPWEVQPWTGTPDDQTIYPGKEASFLTAGATSFSWNMTNIGGATQTVLEWKVQYSLDRLHWIDVTTQGVSGTQTGLTPGVKHYVRWKRRSSSGWGPYSTNMKRQSTDSLEQMIVTPTNAAAGTPANTVAPVLTQPVYPLFWDKYHVAATTPVPRSALTSTTLWCGVGYWTGDVSGTPTYQWKRDGVDIGGATSASYALTQDDYNELAATNITCTVTFTGVTATSNTVVVPLTTKADAWIARMPTAPSGALETLITTFVEDTDAAGYWDKLDGIYAALHTAAASLTNAKGSTYGLSYGSTGGMSASDFVAHRGFTGDGVGKWLDTSCADNASGINWTQDAAVWGCYVNTDGGGTAAALGLTSGSNTFVTPNISGNVRARIHCTANASVSSGSSRLGWSAGIRTASTTSASIRGTTAGTNVATASGAPVAFNLTMFRSGSAYSADQISFMFFGALSKVEYDDFITNMAGPFVTGILAL